MVLMKEVIEFSLESNMLVLVFSSIFMDVIL